MDAVQFFLRRYEPVHRVVTEGLLGELDETQIRHRPVEGVNSIAWIVWHIARAEDLGVSRFIAHRPQLYSEAMVTRSLMGLPGR
jgi:DinB superfamily